jgi:hypothetical protein
MTHAKVEPLDFLAHWWLPEQPSRRVPGRFTWDPDEGGHLQLMGELREPEILDNHLPNGKVQKYRAHPQDLDRRYSVIHGSRRTASGGEEAYTLLHSLSLNTGGIHGPEEIPEGIAAGAVLHGAWYTDPAEIEADRAIFRLRHLSTWVATGGLETKFPRLEGDAEGPYAVIKGHRRAPFATNHDGAKLELRQVLEHTGDHYHTSGLQQSWRLVISIDPMGELERFTDIATDIRALVTIAAGKAADIEGAVLQHPALHKYRLDGTPSALRDDITYLSRWAHRSGESGSVERHELYFNLEQFGGPGGVQRWLETARTYRTELRRVMATRYTDSMYLEDRIMNICASLERFDKERRPDAPQVLHGARLGEPWFIDRVLECITFAGEEFSHLIVERAEVWAVKLRDARNQLAHHDDPFRTTGRVGEHVLAEQAYWLFVMCMLRACAAPESTFGSIMKHRQITWLREQALERVGTATEAYAQAPKGAG